DIVVIQDNLAYAIDFKQKATTDPPHYTGRIYIDLNNFAFRSMEFEVDPKTISSIANSMVLHKPRKIKVKPISASYLVNYKSEGNLYHISLIRAENRFRIRLKKKLFGKYYMVITGLSTVL
ncbi:hypothetical protein LCGC14_1900180, partial [marine sediment metagenome]